jgi:hypothetical protein
MKRLVAGLMVMFLAAPAWAGGGRPTADNGTFDFDQPFDEAISKHALRSLLNRALDAVEDHIELNGRLRSGEPAGDREGRLELKLYPRGKSRSNEHIGAEGSFRFSPNTGNTELKFRFTPPAPSAASSTTPDPADFL